MEYTKKFIAVKAVFEKDGAIRPLEVLWPDGRVFPIDRVTDVRPAASSKVGDAGTRYVCRIGRCEKCLFLDNGRWYVEQAQPAG